MRPKKLTQAQIEERRIVLISEFVNRLKDIAELADHLNKLSEVKFYSEYFNDSLLKKKYEELGTAIAALDKFNEAHQ